MTVKQLQGGQYVFTLVDYFGGTFIFFVLTTVEVISVLWWYGKIKQNSGGEIVNLNKPVGLENICQDVHFMLKQKVGLYWRICWGLITPVVLIIIFIYFVATLEEITYEGKQYPTITLGKNNKNN